MKEKIAERLYEMAAGEHDISIDIEELDKAKSWPWSKLSKSSKDYWRIVAGQTLSLMREEIKKVENPYGISNEGLGFNVCQIKICNLLHSEGVIKEDVHSV